MYNKHGEHCGINWYTKCIINIEEHYMVLQLIYEMYNKYGRALCGIIIDIRNV